MMGATPTKAALTAQTSHISGVLDLFLPLKNSGKALLSISWMLRGKKGDYYHLR